MNFVAAAHAVVGVPQHKGRPLSRSILTVRVRKEGIANLPGCERLLVVYVSHRWEELDVTCRTCRRFNVVRILLVYR